jgi:replicative DNA helicase
MSQSAELPVTAQDAAAEREVLGLCLLSKASLGAAAEALTPADFFHSTHRKVFQAILDLESQGREIGPWEVAETLAGDEEIRMSGGAIFISGLSDEMHSGASVAGPVGLVKKLSERRAITNLVENAAQRSSDATVSNTALVEDLAAGVDAIREGYISAGRGAEHISAVYRDVGPTLERLGDGSGAMFGTPTGFPALDGILPGFVPGELVTLGARPSAGKSALATEFALRQAKSGNAVAIYSLEMSKQLVFLRLACLEGRVDFQALQSGKLTDAGWSSLTPALGRISQLPIWIDARPVVKAAELRWRLRSLAQREKIRLAIVDYMQLLRADGENRTAQVTKISMELKAAASELGQISGGTLISVSQLNRLAACERPQLHHLRESGQIEQDSDVILFLYDDEKLADSGRKEKFLEVAKQRNGPCERIKLAFAGPCMAFSEVTNA